MSVFKFLHRIDIHELRFPAKFKDVSRQKYDKVSEVSFKGVFQENQMLPKIYIDILIMKQIMSVLENLFPFVGRTSQSQDWRKK